MIARILYRQPSYALTDYVFQSARGWEQDGTDRQPQTITGPRGKDITMIAEYIGSAGDQVYHVILSAPKGAELEPGAWQTAVALYLRGMGLSNNAHIAVRHRDTACDHVHILVNRYSPLDDDRGDCDIWRDGDAYARSRAICEEIDRELYRQLRSLDSLRWARVPARAAN